MTTNHRRKLRYGLSIPFLLLSRAFGWLGELILDGGRA